MLSELAIEELNLPPLWGEEGFGTARVDWYVGITGNTFPFNNRETVAEFVAAMMLEAGLNNMKLGNNALNGSDNPFIGVGWCQLDTGYHATSIDFMHELRQNPFRSLTYILETPDLVEVGGSKLWFNKKRWHAWADENGKVKKDDIDPSDGSFNPLQKCMESWDRVFGS
jgi:hypothetical protein